jgi:competence protein ComEA
MASTPKERMQVALAGAVVVLWVGAARGLGDPAPSAGAEPPPCRDLVEVEGLVTRSGVVCARTVREALLGAGAATGCRLDERDADLPLRAGARVVLGEGEGDRCVVRLGAIGGARRLALGLPIDVNLAQPADLEALPGIGPVLAARIVAERNRGGPFATVDELRRVRGIGPKTLGRIRTLVSAEGP